MMRSVSLESEHVKGGWLDISWTRRPRPVNVHFQHCPDCDMPFGVPLNCHHATCEKRLGGCGMEFCFICAAPRAPILAHGNMFHRSACPFNVDTFCCRQSCLSKGNRTCVELQYKPSCPECVKLGRPCDFPENDAPPDKSWQILDKDMVEEEIRLMNKQPVTTR